MIVQDICMYMHITYIYITVYTYYSTEYAGSILIVHLIVQLFLLYMNVLQNVYGNRFN